MGEGVIASRGKVLYYFFPMMVMANDITNAALLKELQTMKIDLQTQIVDLRDDLQHEMTDLKDGLQHEMTDLKDGLRQEMTDLKDGMQHDMTDLKDGLQHDMTDLKDGLQQDMTDLKEDRQQQLGGLDRRITKLEIVVRDGFEDARQHRQALQEDLYATIKLQSKQERTLARLARSGSR